MAGTRVKVFSWVVDKIQRTVSCTGKYLGMEDKVTWEMSKIMPNIPSDVWPKLDNVELMIIGNGFSQKVADENSGTLKGAHSLKAKRALLDTTAGRLIGSRKWSKAATRTRKTDAEIKYSAVLEVAQNLHQLGASTEMISKATSIPEEDLLVLFAPDTEVDDEDTGELDSTEELEDSAEADNKTDEEKVEKPQTKLRKKDSTGRGDK